MMAMMKLMEDKLIELMGEKEYTKFSMDCFHLLMNFNLENMEDSSFKRLLIWLINGREAPDQEEEGEYDGEES